MAEKFAEQLAKSGGKVIELEDMGIESLKDLPVFPETVEEVSFMDNEILNPNDIVEILVPLPNLRALWLNGNPVVSACSNFDMIAELMPKLEIINSKLTNKAGEWALLFYGRSQGAKTLEEIETLDLNNKGVLYLQSTEVFEKMVNLKKLNLSGHKEFFMNSEQRKLQQLKEMEGLPDSEKQNVNFAAFHLDI